LVQKYANDNSKLTGNPSRDVLQLTEQEMERTSGAEDRTDEGYRQSRTCIATTCRSMRQIEFLQELAFNSLLLRAERPWCN
jgi:hypothetical protein